MKYIVFGDTGGHFQQLYKALIGIGMTDDYVLPDDVRIIHLGDLVHKGLYSHDIIHMIDTIHKINPDQWIQIIGNHESQYLGGHNFWEKRLKKKDFEVLQRWYDDGFLKYIHVLEEPSNFTVENTKYTTKKPIVFSHAGVTYPFWAQFLRNSVVENYEKDFESIAFNDVHLDGIMLGNVFDIDKPVGPVWAHGINEVWLKWASLETESPFNQIVGHIAPYMFERHMFYPGTIDEFKNLAKVYENERATIAPLNHDTYIGFLDPGFEKQAYVPVQPHLTLNV